MAEAAPQKTPRTGFTTGSSATAARHFMEVALEAKVPGVFDAICRRICEQARRHIQDALSVEAIITDFEGRPLGRRQIL